MSLQSDDAVDKWERLQEVRNAFIAKHSREPTVWFDKLCVDQEQIGNDLQYLPVFLKSCKKVLFATLILMLAIG